MEARYLRVKNWGELQHYAKRNPPWIKLYRKVLEDNAFGELGELEQWQLVRIWLVASRSGVVTVDEEGREVPILASSEPAIRRAIGTLKKVPLEKFIRAGWLIPLSPEEVDRASTTLDPGYSGASTTLDPGYSGASALLDTEKQRTTEVVQVHESKAVVVDVAETASVFRIPKDKEAA